MPFLPGHPFFWLLCSVSRCNPDPDAGCPIFSVTPCWVHVIQPGMEMCGILGQPFIKQFALCYRTIVLSVTLVYCGQTVGWINMKLAMHVGLGTGHTVRWGPSSPPWKGAQQPPPTFKIYGCRLCLHPYNPRPMSVVAKRQDGSRCHLVGR